MNSSEKEIVKMVRSFQRFNVYQVFSDFIEWAAFSIRLPIDLLHRKEIIKDLQALEKKYSAPGEKETMAAMFGLLVMAMDDHLKNDGMMVDVASRIFNALEIQSKEAGQFFTPESVAYMSARTIFDPEKTKREIKNKGYVSLYEPSVGGGGMVLAFASVMKQAGFDPTHQMVVYAGDIDLRCVCMTYVQASLYGLPAVIQHGDTLSLKEWSRWYTPVYVIDLWRFREKRTENVEVQTGANAGAADAGKNTAAERDRAAGAVQPGDGHDIQQLSLPGMRP